MNPLKNFGWQRRRVTVIATLIAGLALAATPAVALTTEEATRVADIISALQPSLGLFAYDEEIADAWFEADAAGEGVIAAAGFDAQSWNVAVDETFRGLMALMPQQQVDDLRALLDLGKNNLGDISEAQKAQLVADLEAEFAAFLALRAEGAAFADAVRPIQYRLNGILQGSAQ